METCTSLAALHGYLSGDGYVIRNPPTQKQKYYIIGFRNTCKELLLDFQEQFENVFLEIPTISKDTDRCSKGSRLLYEFFTERFGSFHSREWSLPKMSKECRRIWLRAFFDCEGWVLNIPSKNRHIGLDSVNHKELRRIAQMLMKDFDIETKLHKNPKRETLRLLIYGKENITQYKKQIGFLHPQKKKLLDEALASFDPWRWHFPSTESELRPYLENILKKKLKFDKNKAEIFSREENLINVNKALQTVLSIQGKIHETKNGLGTTYYYLAIYGKENLERLRELT